MLKIRSLENKTDNSMINFYEHKQMKEFLTEYQNPHFDTHQIKIPFRLAVIAASGSRIIQWLLNLIANVARHIWAHIRMLSCI